MTPYLDLMNNGLDPLTTLSESKLSRSLYVQTHSLGFWPVVNSNARRYKVTWLFSCIGKIASTLLIGKQAAVASTALLWPILSWSSIYFPLLSTGRCFLPHTSLYGIKVHSLLTTSRRIAAHANTWDLDYDHFRSFSLKCSDLLIYHHHIFTIHLMPFLQPQTHKHIQNNAQRLAHGHTCTHPCTHTYIHPHIQKFIGAEEEQKL